MQDIFLKVLQMSMTASLIALVVIGIRLLFRNAPKWTICLLWGLVALRLVCPMSVESSLSLVPDRVATGQIISNVADTPLEEEGIQSAPEGWMEQIPITGEPFYEYAVPQQPAATVGKQIFPVLSQVWITGIVLMLSYSVISYARLRRQMAEATLLRENIWQCGNVDSPFVLGFLRPQIYLPYRISKADAENVIAHEQAHIRRKDHWWKPLGFLLLSVHWFNPVLWFSYILLCRDIEAACDEKVVRNMEKGEKQAYSMALLNCSVHKRGIAACPLAFGEVGVKERVKNVMKYRKPSFWIILIAVIVCVIVAVCFLTDPLIDAPGKEYSITTELTHAQQVEITEAYNRSNKDIAVTIGFQSTEGPTKVDLVYRYKKNGASDWISSGPISLMLGDSTTFTVPEDHHFIVMATSSDKENGEVTFAIKEEHTTARKVVWRDLFGRVTGMNISSTGDQIPGTTYVSHECLYMNPLSSYYALGGDSGCRYLVTEDSFTTIWRNQHNLVSVTDPDLDTAGEGANNIIPVTKWEWQAFPFTDEAWANLYFPDIHKVERISEAYDEMLYQPLTAGKFLLKMDGELWLVELGGSPQTGPYLWSIYSLIPESAMGVAQWEYAPEVSSRSPYFRFAFEMDYKEISAVCVDSPLVDLDASGEPSGASMTIREGNALYWSPVDKDGNLVTSAIIHFTVHDGDIPYSGTIYIDGSYGSDERRIYTATIVGTGLRLEPNSEQEGGVISVRGSSNAPQILEYDLTRGDIEMSVPDLGNYVFYTNSEQISVTVSGTDFEGKVNLYDISQNNALILQSKVNDLDDDCLFTGLTSARLYRIACEDLDGCTVIISGDQ